MLPVRGPDPMHPDSEGRRWLQQVLPTLPVDPSLFPYQLDLEQNLVLMIQMTETDYERAAFLDERIISPETKGSWLPLPGLVDIRRRVVTHRPPAWLFHLGHCGSTLVSRLLGAHRSLLALREPTVLQAFSHAFREPGAQCEKPVVELCLALLSRSYRKDQRALIKLTSDCNNLIGPLLDFDSNSTGLLLTVSLETYAATMLRAAPLREDMAVRHPARLHDLESLLDVRIGRDCDDGRRAAISWLSGMTLLAQAHRRFRDRLLWLDFDDFLAAPARRLTEVAAFLQTPFSTDEAAALIQSPLMQRYSKNLDKGYTAAIRAADLRSSRERHGDEIAAALRFAEQLAAKYPPIADLHRFFRRADHRV